MFFWKKIIIPGKVRNGPFDLIWKHNHKLLYSSCFVKNGNNKQFYKNVEYVLIKEDVLHEEGLWNQIHIKEPDIYLLGDKTIYKTEQIITKDRIPPIPIAPFTCEIFVDGTKSNGWSRCNPSKFRHHNKGDQIEKKRYYGKRWVLKERDYRSWGETIEYQKAIGYNGPKSGTLTLIW